MKRAMLIINPSSGGEKAKDFEKQAKNKLNEAFDEISVLYTEGAGDATRFARKSCEEKYHSVFAMGGDGTINEVINGLAEQEYIPKFGFFPLGTVNDLARALNISMDPEEAIEQFDINSEIKLDIGKINDTYFMNVIAIGVLPEAINDVESEEKTKLGKFAYYISAFKSLINLETYKFIVEMDGKGEEIETSTILIGLTNSVGGFETLFPDAEVNDGLLNFLSIKDKHIFDTIKSIRDLLTGVDSSTDNLKYARFRKGRISMLDAEKTLTVNIDGDEGPELPIEVTVLPRHIRTYYCKK